MGSMSRDRFVRWRANCEFHSARRAEQRSIGMSAHDLAKLSSLIDSARTAFEMPNITRYRIGVRRGDGTRIRVVFDTTLSTVVTVLSLT